MVRYSDGPGARPAPSAERRVRLDDRGTVAPLDLREHPHDVLTSSTVVVLVERDADRVAVITEIF